MSLVADIAASYRRPRAVVARLLAQGPREDRALVFLMLGCGVMFVAQWPRLAREAHISGQDLDMLLGASLFALLFIVPLALYVFAALVQLALRAARRTISGYGSRLALFWALLTTTPVLLLWGLVAGFIGPGPALSIIGFAWLTVFLWVWGNGLMAARGATP